jgi:hypothetical protein
MARKKPNKSQLIRSYKAKHPTARPVEIVRALKAHKVSHALVGNVLHRANGGKKAKKGRTFSGKPIGLTLETLVAAKKLVVDLGGIENVRKALAALESLG